MCTTTLTEVAAYQSFTTDQLWTADFLVTDFIETFSKRRHLSGQ